MKHSNTVALCCDAQYLPYTAFVATQIIQNTGHRTFDVCICSNDELQLPESLRHLNIQIVKIKQDPKYNHLKTTHLPLSAYLRLWLADALGAQYKKILYLDGDIHVENPNLEHLFTLDLKSHAVGAVRDMQQWLNPHKHVRDFVSAKLPAAPYFNSGLLLIDAAKFNAQDVLNRCLNFALQTPQALYHHDQSVLNCVLHNDWTELSPLWNWQWAGKRPFWNLSEDIQISHFAGNDRKPWNDPFGYCPPRYRSNLQLFLSTHFPDFRPQGVLAPAQLKEGWYWLRMLAEHLLIRSRIRRYIQRFPSLDSTHPIG